MFKPGLIVAIGLSALLGLLFVAGVAGIGAQPVLVVEDDDGTDLLAVPVEDGTVVTLEYTHSVEKTDVRDVYEVRSGRLVIVQMEFRSYGAGLPSEADVERTDDGTFVYRPPDTRSGELVVATGPIADHDLVVDGTRYDLASLADNGSVRIAVRDRFAT